MSTITLDSDKGDFVGSGNSYEYSLENAVITVEGLESRLTIEINGDEKWSAAFKLPDSYSELQPGSYSNLTRFPFHNPADGGLSWTGSFGCSTITGWLIIDKVAYVDDALSEIELRFEQHCNDNAAALHGTVKWYAANTTTPAGPINPIPEDLWNPAPELLPDSGNFVYLERERGDVIGESIINTYTDIDTISVSTEDNLLTVLVADWDGYFQGMSSITIIKPGYYGGLHGYMFGRQNARTKGAIRWTGYARGCSTYEGWFAVDAVNYTGTRIDSIDMRFEQHCDGKDAAVYGKIHWTR